MLLKRLEPVTAEPSAVRELMDAPTQAPTGFENDVASGSRGSIAKQILLISSTIERNTAALLRLYDSLEI